MYYTKYKNQTNLCVYFQDTKCEVLSLLEEYDFYNHLDIILTSLFTLDYMVKGPKSLNSLGERGSEKSYSSGSEPREFQINVSTPGFVKAICILLYNIVELAPKEICARLQERGLVKLIFRFVFISFQLIMK